VATSHNAMCVIPTQYSRQKLEINTVMRIYEVIQEANKFTQDQADAITGDYRSNRLADLGDLIKQKQKADAKTQSWRGMKQTGNGDSPTLSKSYGTQRRDRGVFTDKQRQQMQTYAGIKSRPVSVEPDSSSNPINTGVRELFNQGMSPSEIEDYLVFQKKIKRNLARKMIDRELYQPASRPPKRNPIGNHIFYAKNRAQRKQSKQKQNDDDEEATT